MQQTLYPGGPGAVHQALRKRPLKHGGEFLIMAALVLCTTVSLVTTALIIYVLFSESATFFQEVSLADFFLESSDTLVPEVGYVSMPPELLDAQFAKLEPFLP